MTPSLLSSPPEDRAARARRPVEVAALPSAPRDPERAPLSAAALRNVHMMHMLERIAGAFADAGVPLMALKGAALNLTVYARPDERSMADLDLMVHPRNVDRAFAVLETLGGLRSPGLFREDFFPRFHDEVQYRIGSLEPVTIDLHARPWRPLRLARSVPDAAFWERAVEIRAGAASLLVPCAEDMLTHLATHMGLHGLVSARWSEDIRRWLVARQAEIDWPRWLADVERRRLVAAVRRGFTLAGSEAAGALPASVRARLAALPASPRDRLVVWHAPRDRGHLARSALVNLVATPGWRFRLAYLAAVLMPDRAYMDAWRDRHGGGPRHAAVLARCLAPLRRLARFVPRRSLIAVRPSTVHGHGVFARRDVRAGDRIASYRPRPTERSGPYVAYDTDERGVERRHEITGPLRFLNHSCRPSAQLAAGRLVALRSIAAGEEITIDYGCCTCRRSEEKIP